MDSDGDITDTFDDDELAKTIESGHKGPWNDDSAVFEDPKVAELKKELAGEKSTDYQQRRMRELQKRTAKTAAAAPAEPKQPAAEPSWGEQESHWDEQTAANDTDGKPDWGNQPQAEFAEPDTSVAARVVAEPIATAPAQRPALAKASQANTASAPAEDSTPNYAVATIAVIVVLAAGAIAYGMLAS